jgi:membrane-associated phospholipid phosphatase
MIPAVRSALLASVGAIFFGLAPIGSAQDFSRPYQPLCLRLICSPEKSYSFDAAPYVAATQESSSQPAALPRAAVDFDPVREGAWRKLPSNFLHDQKDIWLFPVKVAEGQHWLPAAIFGGALAGLIASDPQTMPYFRQTDAFQDSNRALNSTVSGGLIAVVPVTFYAVSLIRKNSYDQATSLLAGEAVVDDTILMVVAKAITRRLRPTDIPVNGNYSDTFFKSNNGPLGKGSSFPSGHAMMSFSIATIFARRYREHRWVPYVAYGLASAISFSRLTTGAHFPSDVLFGAATGFAIARFSVLHGQ